MEAKKIILISTLLIFIGKNRMFQFDKENTLNQLSFLSKKVIIIWLIYSLICFSLIAVIIWPSLSHFWRLRKQEKILTAEMSRYRLKYNQLSNIDSQQLDVKIKRSLELLPVYHDAPLIIGILSNLSQEYRLDLGNVTFAPGKVASNSFKAVTPASSKQKKRKISKAPKKLAVNELKLNFSFKGKLADVRHFLEKLEQIKPLLNIKKISMNFPISEPINVDTSIAGNVSLSFFSVNLPNILPSLASPLTNIEANDEEKYQKLIRDYQSFSYITNNPPAQTEVNSVSGNNPFNYR